MMLLEGACLECWADFVHKGECMVLIKSRVIGDNQRYTCPHIKGEKRE